jgi:Tfp pilus assembly protein PilO
MNTNSLQSKRFWLVGGLVVALLIVAASWLMIIHPKLAATSSLHSQTQAEQLQESVLLAKTAKLKKQSENITALRADLAKSVAALPSDSGLPAFTQQLSAEASTYHVTLTSIVIGSITASTSTAGASGSTVATGTTVGGIYKIPVTIISTGTLADQIAFLNAIETGPRSALITSTQLAVGGGAVVASIDAGASVTTQLAVFSAPQSPQQAAVLEKLLNGTVTK